MERYDVKSLLSLAFVNVPTSTPNYLELTKPEDWSVVDDKEYLGILNEALSFKQQGGKIFIEYIYS